MSNEQSPMGEASHPFNPKEHVIQLKSKEGAKDYLPVQWRLVWFREKCPQGTIDTEEVLVDLDREVHEEAFVWNAEKRRSEKIVKTAHGYARFRAVVTDGKGGSATGTKSENAASFPDFIEKAETGAIGRALAALGYGTQFAPEMDEAQRIVDSPVERSSSSADNGTTTTTNNNAAAVNRNASQGGNTKPTGARSTPTAPTSQPAASPPPVPTPAPKPQPPVQPSPLPVTPGTPQNKPLPTTIEGCQEELTRLKMGEFGNYERAAMFCWVCDTKKLPEDQKKWELEHYQKAIEGVREWQNNPENSEKWRADVPLPKMQERMKKYVQAPVYGTPVLMRFSIKTFNDNKKGYGNLNCGEMDELLTTLDQCAVDIAAASAVDGKTFGLLTSTYPDAKHPLDLLNDERIDEWKEYMTKIRQKVNSGEVKLPDQLIKAYEKDLPRFLATPAFTREPATAQ